MLEKLILLIDSRMEMRTKYKKSILPLNYNIIIHASIRDALNDITLLQPDLILISDSTSPKTVEDIKNLRLLTYNFRPVIVALCSSADLQKKLDMLDAGADDYIEEPILKEEFAAKINAHIRRVFESQTNIHTNLYNAKISYKTINRAIASAVQWAVMLININFFDEYKNMYGELAADKMLQTYGAIIKATINENDYLGQLGNDDFLVITNPMRAEKIATCVIRAFDVIAQKFYNSQDAMRGYILQKDIDIEEEPVPIVNTSIAIVSNEFKRYKNLKELMTDLLVLHKTCRGRKGSGYIKDRPKITGADTIAQPQYNNKVLLIEHDEALSLLLESNLILRNYEVKKVSQVKTLNIKEIDSYNPALIIIDAPDEENLNILDFCKYISRTNAKTKIILTTSFRNKNEILNSGVDLYLPKPYEIITLIQRAEKLLKEFNFNN